MTIVVVTGEPSGRLYAALVERALLAAEPALRLVWFDAGQTRGAVFGFAEGIRSAPGLGCELRAAVRRIAGIAPRLVLLVGFSNYSLLLGRGCRRLGLPVVFLNPPQLWAWGAWRIGLLRRAADRVICLFRFEAEWLRRRGVRACYAGNPLADAVRSSASRAATLARFELDPEQRYIVFMPGSRQSEMNWHRRAFELVGAAGCRRVILTPDSSLLGPSPHDPAALLAAAARRYDALAHAEAAVVVSGTATLETALLGVPQLVCYHLPPLTRLAARLLVRTRRFALPNLLLGRDSVPELLNPQPPAIARELRLLLSDRRLRTRARSDADELRRLLGPPGAADRVARLLLRTVR